jgi:two-component system, LuxR family, sensor kinase FixL
VSEIDGQANSLQTIAKAVRIIAVQVASDGVATALLNLSMELSGAARGAAVLAAKGALLLGENGFKPGLPLVAKLKPDGELKDLPMDLLRTVLDKRAPTVRAFGPGATAFCTPVASGDTVKGLLYLEFETTRREATSESAAAVTLLASQAAMTLDALGDHGPLRDEPGRRAKSPPPGNVASFRWNPATRLASGSPEYYRMLGFDSGPIDFASMTSRVHPADYPTAQAVVDDVVRRRAPYRMEFRIVLPSGDVRNLMWSGSFDLADPDSPELVGVVMDVTELRAADDLLRAAHEDADRQLRLAWLGELAGSIVHEVNQPLASIMSSADAALRWLERDDPDIEAAVKSVERISEIARRAGRTVADMRAMTSSTSLEVVERSMNSIAGEALQISSAMIARMDVRTEIVFDPAKPMVSVNPAQLLQVMLNLVQNAIDSMREVADRSRILGIRTATDAGSVIVEVGDTGVGLPAGDAGRLFDPLYTTKKGGMGLGLAICRRIVLMHGGSIDARSNRDFGAIFVVSLPQTGSD